MPHRLSETENLAVAIAENSAHGIVVMDENGYCLFANRAWTEMTGFSAGDMAGKPVHDWVHHHHPDGRPFPIEDCPIGCTLGKNEQVRSHEDLFFKKDGRPFHVSCAASPILKDGSPILMILEVRDITEEKASERRKDEFLAMLSHELRNPLAPIASAASLLEKTGHLDGAGIKRIGGVIARQLTHLTSLVNDLLDVSRVRHGTVVLDKRKLDVFEALHDAVEQVQPLIAEKRHTLILPASSEPVFILADKKRLVQVLANVLNNAAKYTPEGGTISVRAQTRETQVVLTITDNGIGMTQATAERAFELFSQADRTADRSQGGLGIGLALAKSLVALHGGKISAHSEGPNKGSALTLSLPLCFGTTPHEESEKEAHAAMEETSPLKILIVDDNADAANMLALLLEETGHRALVQHSPHAAIGVAKQEQPDVFFLDIGLPGIDGYELARRLRMQAAHSKALMIALTGYGQEQDRNRAMKAGFDHHLVKPACAEQILALLKGFKPACQRLS